MNNPMTTILITMFSRTRLCVSTECITAILLVLFQNFYALENEIRSAIGRVHGAKAEDASRGLIDAVIRTRNKHSSCTNVSS